MSVCLCTSMLCVCVCMSVCLCSPPTPSVPLDGSHVKANLNSVNLVRLPGRFPCDVYRRRGDRETRVRSEMEGVSGVSSDGERERVKHHGIHYSVALKAT